MMKSAQQHVNEYIPLLVTALREGMVTLSKLQQEQLIECLLIVAKEVLYEQRRQNGDPVQTRRYVGMLQNLQIQFPEAWDEFQQDLEQAAIYAGRAPV